MTSLKKKIGRPVIETVQSWKKKCWKACSEYVRRRDADEDGMIRCCTCGVRKHWKEVDAGHFLDGRGNAILFDIRGIHPQCKPCNGRLKNRRVDNVDLAYLDFMRYRYDEKVISDLQKLRKTTRQFTVPELKKMTEEFKRKIAQLN